MLLKFVGKIF